MITNIISAIGNNRSIYPLILRDCGIEVPSKIYITRKENLKESKTKANDATREKFIDEYATSAVWLGGIPLVEKSYDKFVIKRKGFNPSASIKLFREEEFQGIEYNIAKFKNVAKEEIKDLEKLKNKRKYIEKLTAGKFAAAIIIPTALMGFVLPKMNFALTRLIKMNRKEKEVINSKQVSRPSMTAFTSGKEVSFTGNWVNSLANLKTVDKMAITDGGLTVGRVTTSRNKDEAYVNAFRMIGSMILNFVTPIYIAKFLDKSANKLFGLNVNLDPKIMNNKELIEQIKSGSIELPKSNTPKDLFEFIDTKPQSLFAKFAANQKKIYYLKSGIRDPRRYVDVEDLAKFRTEFENFIKSAKESSDIAKFVKKAKFVKGVNILSNVGISSFLLAVVLPKLQYSFNKLVTGSYSDPGLRDN